MRYLASSVPSGGVLNLVSSIFRRSQTGTLELETEQGQKKLYFVDGQLYLRRSVMPLAEKIGNHLESQLWQGVTEPDVALRELLQLTGEHLAKWKVTSYRFFEGFQVDADELAGPLPTGLLVMEAVSLDDDEEAARLKMMGGIEATLETAISQNPSVIESLNPAETALLGHLQRPTRIGDLLGGSGSQSKQMIRALSRLWVLELVRESGQFVEPAVEPKPAETKTTPKTRIQGQEPEKSVEDVAPPARREEVTESGELMDSGPRERTPLPEPGELAAGGVIEPSPVVERPVAEAPLPVISTTDHRRETGAKQPLESDDPMHLAYRQFDEAQQEVPPFPLSETASKPRAGHRIDVDLRIWNHFGLKSDPFALTPDPRFLFLSESHSEALAGIKLSLLERRGLCVMTGEVGTGKTTLLYSMLSSLGPGFETAYVHNPALPFDQLLEHILDDFGMSVPSSRRRVDLLEKLNEFLIQCSGERNIAALIVDEAQNLSDATFEAIRLLLNFETFDSKLLQIVLVGQPELGERLRSNALRQIKDRVAIRCHLEPLSQAEARSYIANRIESAGGVPGIFSRSAVSLAARRARYIPRRINVLCHNAMLYAYGKGQRKVTKSQVAEAIRDLKR